MMDSLVAQLDYVLNFTRRGATLHSWERLSEDIGVLVRAKGADGNAWECAYIIDKGHATELLVETVFICAGKVFMRRDWGEIKTYPLDLEHGNGD